MIRLAACSRSALAARVVRTDMSSGDGVGNDNRGEGDGSNTCVDEVASPLVLLGTSDVDDGVANNEEEDEEEDEVADGVAANNVNLFIAGVEGGSIANDEFPEVLNESSSSARRLFNDGCVPDVGNKPVVEGTRLIPPLPEPPPLNGGC